jgi:hypothetical protein
MDRLKEIYDKKSPLFIITIAIFILAIIAKGEPEDMLCGYALEVVWFEMLLIVVGGVEIVVKTVGLEVLSRCCSSRISSIHNGVVLGFMLANLALLGWAIHLYLGVQRFADCRNNQPHTYFLQFYACLYVLINIILLLIVVCAGLDRNTMTVL